MSYSKTAGLVCLEFGLQYDRQSTFDFVRFTMLDGTRFHQRNTWKEHTAAIREHFDSTYTPYSRSLISRSSFDTIAKRANAYGDGSLIQMKIPPATLSPEILTFFRLEISVILKSSAEFLLILVGCVCHLIGAIGLGGLSGKIVPTVLREGSAGGCNSQDQLRHDRELLKLWS